ncbi:MAG: ABC transporter ATP-binding protein [Celeribacter sp.]|jgi:peptide/nickel transport system ATP-binding protein
MTDHLLEVRDLSICFHSRGRTVKAVNGVNWHLDRGETLAILGESGSGKSVSASAVMGIIDMPPGEIVSGSITFDGQDLLNLPPHKRQKINGRRIAMIFQDTLAALNPVYSIGRQISESMAVHGKSPSEARARAIELLERVGIAEPERRFHDYPHQFSGGQRQRVMIAAAIAMEPDVLIADEPTSALDVTVQAGILKLLKKLQAETGMSILIITHDLGVAAEVADRVVVMNQGEVVEQGGVSDVLNRPQHSYTKRLLAAVPGRHGYTRTETERGEILLEVENLSKHYGITKGFMKVATGRAIRALDEVSLTLAKGEVLGIVGESGSGKSTLVNTLLGLTSPTSGDVRFRGQSMLSENQREMRALRRQVQVVFQDPTASLNPRMSVARIISEPWAIHRDVLPRSQWRDRVAELLEQVGLPAACATRYPHQFSGGQRQRIAIARALALQPEVIICDEAVSALDVSIQAQVIELLKDLKRQHGLSYLFVAHDLPVVRDFADRTIVMQNGKIVESGRTEDVFERPQHIYTQNLLASRPEEEKLRSEVMEPAR